MNSFITNSGYALLGAILSWLLTFLWERYKFRKEYKSNDKINLAGEDWIGAWQTSVDGEIIFNTEALSLRQHGGTVKIRNKQKSTENPKGGYLWEGQLQFYHGRDLMGWYFSKQSEQNTNKGIMYFNYDGSKKVFVGVWVGSSYDGPLLSGFGVISKTKDQALEILQAICKKHKNKVAIISNNL